MLKSIVYLLYTKTNTMKTTNTLIKEIELKKNIKFDWNKSSHRFYLTQKIDFQLEKLHNIQTIIEKK